jgi:hypothetical protein
VNRPFALGHELLRWPFALYGILEIEFKQRLIELLDLVSALAAPDNQPYLRCG